MPAGKIVPVMLSFLMHETLVLEYYKDPMEQILGKVVFGKPVIGMAMSYYCCYAVVISADKKLKAFHLKSEGFSIPYTLMFETEFPEVPLCLAAHPNNGQVAIGFKENLRVFVISNEELIETNFNLMIKNCEAINYS
jgi:hypothetical protein